MPKNMVLQVIQEPSTRPNGGPRLTARVQVFGNDDSPVQIHVVATQDAGATALGSKSVVLKSGAVYRVPLAHAPGSPPFKENAAINAVSTVIESWTLVLNNNAAPNPAKSDVEKDVVWRATNDDGWKPNAR